MLTLTMMNDDDTALKFKATICIVFAFGQIIVLIIRIWPNSTESLFGTALIFGVRKLQWLGYNLVKVA